MSILICAADSDIDEKAPSSQHAHLRAFNEHRSGTHTFQRTDGGVEHPRRRTMGSGKAHDSEQWASSGAGPSPDDEDEDDDDDDDEDEDYGDDDDMDESSEHGNNGGAGTTTIVLTPIGSSPQLSALTTTTPAHGPEFPHHHQRVHPLLDASRTTTTAAPSPAAAATTKRPSDYNGDYDGNDSNEEEDDDEDEDEYEDDDDEDEDDDEWADEKEKSTTPADRPIQPIASPSSEAPSFTSTTSTATTTTASRQTQTEPAPPPRTTPTGRTSQAPATKKPTLFASTPVTGGGKSPGSVPARAGHLPFFGDLKPGLLALMVGGSLVVLLLLTLCVSYICWRLRKKDEGTYTCDEPRQPRHYSYAYHKASTKEFYA